jgi:hypothetical protein
MQKRHRADDFIEGHYRRRQHGAGGKLVRRKVEAGLQLINEESMSTLDGLGSNAALPQGNSKADKSFCQLSVGLLSDKFVAGTAPETHSADLKKFAAGVAKEIEECLSIGSLRRLGGDRQQKPLERFVGTGERVRLRRRRISLDDLQTFTAFRLDFREFSQVIESNGKVSCDLNLSQAKWGWGALL